MHLILPSNINADGLLPFISCLGEVKDAREILVDFGGLRRVSPAALVMLTACIDRWRKEKRTVVPLNLSSCPILGYLQRMDVLAACGLPLPETFVRHNARGRFVPVRLIDHRVEAMGSEMALCVAPGGDVWGHSGAGPYDFVWYVLTEMANNVRQHSGGRGFAAAQVGQAEGLVRIAIADNGRGIKASFVEAGLPWSSGMSDTDAILKAIEPRISSKGSPSNEGGGADADDQDGPTGGGLVVDHQWLRSCAGGSWDGRKSRVWRASFQWFLSGHFGRPDFSPEKNSGLRGIAERCETWIRTLAASDGAG